MMNLITCKSSCRVLSLSYRPIGRKWNGGFVKSGKWGDCEKWTFPQRRVHYVQYQYFYFTFKLHRGGCIQTPPALGIIIYVWSLHCCLFRWKTRYYNVQIVCIKRHHTNNTCGRQISLSRQRNQQLLNTDKNRCVRAYNCAAKSSLVFVGRLASHLLGSTQTTSATRSNQTNLHQTHSGL